MITKRRVRMRLRLLVGGLVALALLAGAWIWVRDSPLVAVERVTVTGVSGPDAGQIRSALVLAARNMTTLDVRIGQLQMAVAPYPVVKDVRVRTQFPHGMRIRVVEQLPVGALVAGGRVVAASADGTILRDVSAAALPEIPVRSLPAGARVTDPSTLQALALLAATPLRLLSKISQVTTSAQHGLVVQLADGPEIYFGTAGDLAAKWIAATEVIADPDSAGASYIDVSDPERPVAGVSAQAVTAAGLGPSAAQSANSSASTGESQTPGSAAQAGPQSTSSSSPDGG